MEEKKINLSAESSTADVKKDKGYDELLHLVKEYIKENDQISASRIQAVFEVGYPRASKILRQLIEEGLVEEVEEFKYRIVR